MLLIVVRDLGDVPSCLAAPFIVVRCLFATFFAFRCLAHVCYSPHPQGCVFDFFNVMSLLTALPLCVNLLFPNTHCLLVVHTFHLVHMFHMFGLFGFLGRNRQLLATLHRDDGGVTIFFLFIIVLIASVKALVCVVRNARPSSRFGGVPGDVC